MAITSQSPTTVRGLGEIALRVNNLDAIQKFYEEVIRLTLMPEFRSARSSKSRTATEVTHKSSRVRPLK